MLCKPQHHPKKLVSVGLRKPGQQTIGVGVCVPRGLPRMRRLAFDSFNLFPLSCIRGTRESMKPPSCEGQRCVCLARCPDKGVLASAGTTPHLCDAIAAGTFLGRTTCWPWLMMSLKAWPMYGINSFEPSSKFFSGCCADAVAIPRGRVPSRGRTPQ